ncbi:hypothetical protein [Nonomuraea sp. NPDC049309]|uniref:hypothetical protein n=1 Tax=Nonomuraea sp. NPDC049309 TaxID=3364350 RepID=UPI00371AB072
MTHPSAPDPWGPQAHGRPEPGGREPGRPPYGHPATPARRHQGSDAAGYGDHEVGPADRVAQGPPPGFGARRGRHSQPSPPDDGYPYAPQDSNAQGYGSSYEAQEPYGRRPAYEASYGDQTTYREQDVHGAPSGNGAPSGHGEQSGYGEQGGYRERDGYGEQGGYGERGGSGEQGGGYRERGGSGEQGGYLERGGYPEQDGYADRSVYTDRGVHGRTDRGVPGEQDSYGGPYASYGRHDDYGPPSHPHPHYGSGPHDPYTHQRLQDGFDHLTPATLDPPLKRGKTMVIALSAALGVLLLGGGTVGAISYVKSSNGTPAALPSGGTKPSATAPWPSDEPAEADAGGDAPPSDDSSPKGDPSSQGEPSAAGEPKAEEVPSGEPTGPATTPSPSSSAVQPGSPIAHTEFDDWKFDFSGATFAANKVGGWTYGTCEPVDAQGLLEQNKCRRAVQLAYSAYRGHLKAIQVLLEFPSVKAATNAATQMVGSKTDTVNVRRDMALPTYEYGKIRTTPAKKYVVVTIVTADKTAKAKADDFHLYMQADRVSYFLLRDVTITS